MQHVEAAFLRLAEATDHSRRVRDRAFHDLAHIARGSITNQRRAAIGDELLLVKHSVAPLLSPQGLIVADEIDPESMGPTRRPHKLSAYQPPTPSPSSDHWCFRGIYSPVSQALAFRITLHCSYADNSFFCSGAAGFERALPVSFQGVLSGCIPLSKAPSAPSLGALAFRRHGANSSEN